MGLGRGYPPQPPVAPCALCIQMLDSCFDSPRHSSVVCRGEPLRSRLALRNPFFRYPCACWLCPVQIWDLIDPQNRVKRNVQDPAVGKMLTTGNAFSRWEQGVAHRYGVVVLWAHAKDELATGASNGHCMIECRGLVGVYCTTDQPVSNMDGVSIAHSGPWMQQHCRRPLGVLSRAM